MRIYKLMRQIDIHGISKTGFIAIVIEFNNGITIVHWFKDIISTTMYLSLEDAMKIHGHNTTIEEIGSYIL